jgi:hypothetical protein
MCSVFVLFDLSIIVLTNPHTSIELTNAQVLHSVEINHHVVPMLGGLQSM